MQCGTIRDLVGKRTWRGRGRSGGLAPSKLDSGIPAMPIPSYSAFGPRPACPVLSCPVFQSPTPGHHLASHPRSPLLEPELRKLGNMLVGRTKEARPGRESPRVGIRYCVHSSTHAPSSSSSPPPSCVCTWCPFFVFALSRLSDSQLCNIRTYSQRDCAQGKPSKIWDSPVGQHASCVLLWLVLFSLGSSQAVARRRPQHAAVIPLTTGMHRNNRYLCMCVCMYLAPRLIRSARRRKAGGGRWAAGKAQVKETPKLSPKPSSSRGLCCGVYRSFYLAGC
ncbi:hypothetical protein B0T24DRAFT_293174 [Lasiosphaeria ovina]|uniref:Uncharacterized protein n=1 Tax=Lasiosphaeria ovina TaxID=92902 RepID=A0AAE0KDA3_9PEZI|nr:hypothetical protein B0T24DRAFT_293174 [Lasiosphaeria ovina]